VKKARNIAASVRDRLLTHARARKEDFQLVLTRYAIERLLYRISRSAYQDQFLLKGAMLFLVWTGQMYRPTRDLDLLGRGSNDIHRMETVFRELCAVTVEEDGVSFLAETVSGQIIREDDDYEGVRIRLVASLGEARIHVQVDVAFGDAVKPHPEEADYPVLLPFPAPHVRIYPREAVVAEKFQIMVALGIANSRMKDFADVWSLARAYRFDGRTLSDAIEATFARRDTPVPTEPPLAFTDEFSSDRAKQAQWRAFLRRSRLEDMPHALRDVVLLLEGFLMGPARAVARQDDFNSAWPPGGPWQEAVRPTGRAARRS
jgi:predicted nucleotidyltransferase component of viral defense system